MEGQNTACLRYVEQVILDTAQLYGIEEVLGTSEVQLPDFPQLVGCFEGEKLGGDFVVQSKHTSPMLLATLTDFLCRLLDQLGMQPVAVRLETAADDAHSLVPMLEKLGICYTIRENDNKNNIKLTILGQQEPYGSVCTEQNGVQAKVQAQKLAAWVLHNGIELPRQKGCTLAITAAKAQQALALGLARQLREEGFVVTVDETDHADRVGAAFVCRLDEASVQAGTIAVESVRTGRTDQVQLSEQALSAYIYEQTMMDAMEQVENSLESPKEFDFSKGFHLF